MYDPNDKFASFEELRTYARNVLRSEWLNRNYPVPYWNIRIEYHPQRHGAVTRNGHVLGFGPRALGKQIVLHEIAHLLERSGAWHGREWARVYVEIVQHFLGVERANKLRAEFRAGKVKYTKPRQYTPEQREALRERGRQLAASRQPKQEN